MDDGTIRISTQVDVSGLRAGMQEAVSVAQSSGQSMAAAMEAARTASKNLADAQLQLGSAAAAGSREAAAVLEQYSGELQHAQAAVAALAAAESGEAIALQQTISARMAASAELRVLEGGFQGSTRAASAFLSTLPGIGSAMQLAFPVFGAIAFGEVVARVGSQMGDLAADAREVADTLGGSMWDGISAMVQGVGWDITELNKQTDTFLLKAHSLSQEAIRFQADQIKRSQGPDAAARYLAGASLPDIENVQQRLRQAHQELSALQAKAQETSEHYNAGSGALEHTPTRAALSAKTDIPAKRAEVEYLEALDTELQEKRSNILQQGASEQERIAQRKAHAEAQAAERSQRAWAEMSRETTELLNRQTEQEIQAFRKLDEIQKPRHLNFSPEDTGELQMSQAIDKYVDSYSKLGDAQVEASGIQQQNADALQAAQIRAQEAAGSLKPLAAAEQMAALHAAAYEQALAKLNAQLEVQQQLGKDVEAAQTQNQISQLQGARAVQATGDAATIQQQVAKPWTDAFQQINQGWLQVQNQMLYTTRNIGMVFAQTGQNLVISGMDAAEKWFLGWAEKELMMVVLHHTSIAQKAASDAAANATTLAQGTTTNVALAQSYAATAAAAAASVAAIPVTGWAMAPGIASATYAETAAFAAMASFDTGTGYVPRDGLAYIHKGEAVVPAPTMEDLRGSSGGGDINVTQHNNWNTMTDAEFRRQLNRHAADVAGAVQKHLRQQGRV